MDAGEAGGRDSRSAVHPSGEGSGASGPSSSSARCGAIRSSRCANCGVMLVGPWCAACGQRVRDLDRPFRVLAGEFVENVLSFDGRAVRTLGQILLRPGELS